MKTSNILIKNSKWKTFIFFLFLASLFWVLTKISKEFTAPVTSKIQFTNVPETVSIKEVNAEEITFNLYSSGYDFLGYKLKQPDLLIDVSKYISNTENKINITSTQLVEEINEQFSTSRSVNSLNIDALLVTVDPIIRKKVPVVVQKRVSYKNGFRQIGSINITPDSIYVSGPQKVLAHIDSLTTENIKIDLVDGNISKKVTIKIPDIDGISLSNETVVASWVVKEIAQKEFEVPIAVINKPKGEIIKIIPNVIKLRVDITLDHYNDITSKDFKIVCDYNKRNTDENFMIAHIDKIPQWVEHIELGTQKIDFLIFQE